MKALFINTNEPACGVHAYGLNLYSVLEPSNSIDWFYCEPLSEPELRMAVEIMEPDCCVVNYQALIGGFLAGAPFPYMKRSFLVYHDCDIDESRWNGIFFSDPTMQPKTKWCPIGRPIPEFKVIMQPLGKDGVVIGVHGFLGAWSDQVVKRVINEFEYATIRLQLPYSKFCDPNGDAARGMADCCRQMVYGTGVNLEISHEFLPQPQLLQWLAQNDLNCYIRPVEMNWRGVSSAPDCALAVRKPIAVNSCNAFRHLHRLSPSICVEDNPLEDIIRNGLSPLVPLYSAWAPEVVRQQVEAVLMNL